MATELELTLALMAGRSYESTRAPVNWFPTPSEWVSILHTTHEASGFEAIAFVKEGKTIQTSPEIVISYAGTYDQSAADIAADVALYGGRFHAQLLQAARYYLDIRAANPGKLGSDSN